MDELARKVDSKPGWSFELLLVAEPEKLETPGGARSFERESIGERIEEAEAALNAGHAESAFLLAWSACEAGLRLLIGGQDVPIEGITTTAHTLEQAAFLGVISRDEYQAMTTLQKHRNAIVHGFSDADFSEERVRELLQIVRGIAAA